MVDILRSLAVDDPLFMVRLQQLGVLYRAQILEQTKSAPNQRLHKPSSAGSWLELLHPMANIAIFWGRRARSVAGEKFETTTLDNFHLCWEWEWNEMRREGLTISDKKNYPWGGRREVVLPLPAWIKRHQLWSYCSRLTVKFSLIVNHQSYEFPNIGWCTIFE